MKKIKDFTLEELKEQCIEMGEKPFRATQIWEWLYREKVTNFQEMTNLSVAFREQLVKQYTMR